MIDIIIVKPKNPEVGFWGGFLGPKTPKTQPQKPKNPKVGFWVFANPAHGSPADW